MTTYSCDSASLFRLTAALDLRTFIQPLVGELSGNPMSCRRDWHKEKTANYSPSVFSECQWVWVVFWNQLSVHSSAFLAVYFQRPIDPLSFSLGQLIPGSKQSKNRGSLITQLLGLGVPHNQRRLRISVCWSDIFLLFQQYSKLDTLLWDFAFCSCDLSLSTSSKARFSRTSVALWDETCCFWLLFRLSNSYNARNMTVILFSSFIPCNNRVSSGRRGQKSRKK